MLLTTAKALATLRAVIAKDVSKSRSSLFGRTIARVLRILVRALELASNHYTPLDLGFSAPLAPAIAAYVARASQPNVTTPGAGREGVERVE